MKRVFPIFTFLWLSLSPLLSQSQQGLDSYVRLISADKAQLLEIDGKPFRKVEGSAVFFHNNTRLQCDTAYWNVEEQFIDARGNVKIIQENTILTGDSLHYIAQNNTAEFRGSLVQLLDRDNNILRTNHLDYNLKDSIAYFYYGASMKDVEGNIIESDRGVFNSKISSFTFIDNVQMFSDSLFFVSDSLVFLSDINTAFFGKNTRAWRGDNYLASNGGWYDQSNDKIFFDGDTYTQTPDYEVWSETLFYDRVSLNSKLENDIQILDTINNTLILADQLIYEGSSKYTEITKEPVIVGITEENGLVDSLFMTADTILYYIVRMCDIDSASIILANERRELAAIDVFEKARANMIKVVEPATAPPSGRPGIPTAPGSVPSINQPSMNPPVVPPQGSLVDTTQTFLDSLQIQVPDSLARLDTIPKIILPPDTTEVKFIEAYHGVKLFKSDFQMLCDSLIYTGVDSIARLYTDPVLWSEVTNQLSADSIQLVMEGGQMRKGYLLSNAFVIAEDVPTYYNQIRSPEMVGYFDQGELYRYDAMGGVSSVFYLEQDSVVNTIIKKESKVMSARLKNGELERVYNLEAPKTDAYPLYDLSLEEQRLRGFNLRDAQRPSNRDSITTRKIRKSIRERVINAPIFPVFNSTSVYFPEYIGNIMIEINQRTPLKWKNFDPNYVDDLHVSDFLHDNTVDTTRVKLEGREKITDRNQDEALIKESELKIDSVQTGEVPSEMELSDKEKRAELKILKEQERRERRVAKRKKSIARKLKKEEEER